nr:SBBP repeat-containing protein [Deltaproteobacteria bacterium]
MVGANSTTDENGNLNIDHEFTSWVELTPAGGRIEIHRVSDSSFIDDILWDTTWNHATGASLNFSPANDDASVVVLNDDGSHWCCTQTSTYGDGDSGTPGNPNDPCPASLDWAVKAGGIDYDWGQGIAVDSNGNIYITGRFYGTAEFGSTTLTSAGGNGVFIAKVDSSGNYLWAVKAGGSSDDRGNGIAVDSNGNSYITGYFGGTAEFGSTTLTSAGGNGVFIAKVDSSGNYLWAVKAGGSSDDRGNGIAVDSNGNS